MTDEQILMRQGVKRLPFEIYAAMTSKRQMFGTANPHVFDFVYESEEHYRVTLEIEHIEVPKDDNIVYRIADFTSIEYTPTLGLEPNNYAMTDDDHTCILNSLNEGQNPLFKLHAVKMSAERFEQERFTMFDIGVIFHLDQRNYVIETSFVLSEDTIRDRPELGDSQNLHRYISSLADDVLWNKLPHVVGRYVTKSLRGTARTTLSRLMQIDSTQTALREEQALAWRQAEMIRPLFAVDIGLQPEKKKRRRHIDLWGTL